jgi:hypothetical protein
MLVAGIVKINDLIGGQGKLLIGEIPDPDGSVGNLHSLLCAVLATRFQMRYIAKGPIVRLLRWRPLRNWNLHGARSGSFHQGLV